MLERVVLGCLVLVAGCVPADATDIGPAPVWALTWSPLCADLDNELDCARSIERARLPEYPEVAWRSVDTLYTVTGHSTYRFIDVRYDPGERHTSFLHYFAQLKLFLIHQISGEDGQVLVIDAQTGDTLALPDCPRMGPVGARLLVATNFVIGHNELQIWRFRPFRSELATGSHLWRIPRAVWRDSSSIEVTRVPTSMSAGDEILPAPEVSILVRTDDGWQEIPAE